MYCTVTALRAVLSAQGQTDTATAASLSDAALQAAIDDATLEVNAQLGARYDVPFDDDREGQARPVPGVVANLTRDIAAYKATLTYRRGAPLEPTDPAVLRYQMAAKLLTALMKGTATLSLENSPAPDQAVQINGQPFNLACGPLFAEHDFGMTVAVRRGSLGWPSDSY